MVLRTAFTTTYTGLYDERGVAKHWVHLPDVPPEAVVEVCATYGYPTLEAHRAALARWADSWGTTPATPVVDALDPDLIYWIRIVIHMSPQEETTDV